MTLDLPVIDTYVIVRAPTIANTTYLDELPRYTAPTAGPAGAYSTARRRRVVVVPTRNAVRMASLSSTHDSSSQSHELCAEHGWV